MRKALTPKLLDSLKPAAGKRYEVRDSLIIGLLLRVSKTGGKVWYVLPRVRGRAVRIKIGTYPILTLAQARERARQLLGDAQLGRLTKERLDAERLPTLGEIIPEFIELYAKKRNKDWKETQRVLTKFASLGKCRSARSSARTLYGSSTTLRPRPPYAPTARLLRSRSCSPGRSTGALWSSILWQASRSPRRRSPGIGFCQTRNWLACWQASEQEGTPFEQFVKLLILTGQRRGKSPACGGRDRLRACNLDDPGEARQERHSSCRTLGTLGAGNTEIHATLPELRSCLHDYRPHACVGLWAPQRPPRQGSDRLGLACP